MSESRATNYFNKLVVAFFILHIPATIFIDSQAAFPAGWYPAWARNVNDWYIQSFGDPLMGGQPPWFKVLVLMEVFLQLPFFLIGSYAFAARREWIRIPALVYGLNVASTMVPILAELALTPAKAGFRRGALLGFYLPYFIIPAAIAVRVLCAGPYLFSQPSRPRYRNH